MPLAAASLFLVCLATSLGSSFALARALDRIGVRLGLTDAVIGMLTALGADAPEISTAAAPWPLFGWRCTTAARPSSARGSTRTA